MQPAQLHFVIKPRGTARGPSRGFVFVRSSTCDDTAMASTSFPLIPGRNDATASISAVHGVAYEHNQVPDTYIVTRSGGNTSAPLAVNYSLSGDDASEYKVADTSGNILSGSVTIPASATFSTIVITPVEDNLPEWTDTLKATLTASGGYDVSSTAGTASIDIVNDNLGVTLGSGSGDIVLQGSSAGSQNLVPLYLSIPGDIKDGATLTDSQPGEADVWTSSNPGSGTQPILGMVNGTATGSITWTYGVSTLPSSPLWVGGLAGSATVGDIVFSLSDSDAGASPAPAHPTTNSASTRPATNVAVTITSYNNPNDVGQPASLDVTGKTRDWLVGQMVDLKVNVAGPFPFMNVLPVVNPDWTAPGNVLYNYVDNDQSATTTDLAVNNTNLGNGTFSNVGTKQAEVRFFWVDDADGENYETQQVSVSGVLLGKAFTASTTFSVEEPISSLDATEQGNTALYDPSQNPGKLGIWGTQLGDQRTTIGGTPHTPTNGIQITGSVQVPTGFAVGQWKVIQLAVFNRTATSYLVGGIDHGIKLPFNGLTVLDAGDPYRFFTTGELQNAVFSTGAATQVFVDNPGIFFEGVGVRRPNGNVTEETITALSINDAFSDYLMFKPPGDSRWVPVADETWSWQVSVSRPPGAAQYSYNSPPSGPEAASSPRSTTEPQWNVLAPSPLPPFVLS